MNTEPIDLDLVAEQHKPELLTMGWFCSGCGTGRYVFEEGCLIYRLAIEAKRLAGKVVRVEALHGIDSVAEGADAEKEAAVQVSTEEYDRLFSETWDAIANGLSSAARARMSEEDVNAITHRVMTAFGMDEE